MTTKSDRPSGSRKKNSLRLRSNQRGSWQLRDAKARFSEVVQRAHEEGPQRVTVRGKQAVVVIAADEFRKLKGEITGRVLVDALANSPLRDVEFERLSIKSPVRDVEL
jgi:prevent-host-death family protein